MKAVVAAFNQEKALVGAFSVITNLRMELFEALVTIRVCPHDVIYHNIEMAPPGHSTLQVKLCPVLRTLMVTLRRQKLARHYFNWVVTIISLPHLFPQMWRKIEISSLCSPSLYLLFDKWDEYDKIGCIDNKWMGDINIIWYKLLAKWKIYI